MAIAFGAEVSSVFRLAVALGIGGALQDIPTDIVATHDLPARPVAGLRNALAHTHEDMLD